AGGAPAGGGAVHGAMRLAPMARGPAHGAIVAAAPALNRQPEVHYTSFDRILALLRDERYLHLLDEVETGRRLVQYSPGRIESEPAPGAARDLAAKLSQRLQGWTRSRWGVSVVTSGGAPTIAEIREEERRAAETGALQNPLVKAVLTAFPKAKITDIRTAQSAEAEAALEALPEVEADGDDWDPFEE